MPNENPRRDVSYDETVLEHFEERIKSLEATVLHLGQERASLEGEIEALEAKVDKLENAMINVSKALYYLPMESKGNAGQHITRVRQDYR